MLPFDMTIPATVPQRLEIPEGLMNYTVYLFIYLFIYSNSFIQVVPSLRNILHVKIPYPKMNFPLT